MSEQKKIENAIKYTPEKWDNSLTQILHTQIINETIELIKKDVLKNGVTIYFHGKDLHFNCLKEDDLSIVWKFAKLDNIDGQHIPENNMIELNINLNKNGPLAYETIYHEYAHHIQCALSKYVEQYPKDSLEYEFLTLIKNEATHLKIRGCSFGMEFDGEVYVDMGKITNTLGKSDLFEAFYALQISERIAATTGQEAYRFVLSLSKKQELIKQYENREMRQEKAANIIRNEYKIYGSTYDDICRLMDSAKENIIFKKIPTERCDIEAMITYKLAAILQAQSLIDVKQVFDVKDIYKQQINNLQMQNSLYFYYKEVNKSFSAIGPSGRVGDLVFINDLYELLKDNYFTAEDLYQLTEEEQIRNPMIIVAALFHDHEDVIPTIKNEDAFKVWYYSQSNQLSERMMTVVADIMGPDYRPEVQKEMNEKMMTVLRKEYSEYNDCENDYLKEKFRYDEVEENFDDQEFIEPKGHGE